MFIKALMVIGIIATITFAQNDGDTKTITAGGTSIEVVFVKAGSFTTQGGILITLTEGFWIGKYPITQAQYEAVMGNNPSFFSGNPNNPVEQVNWYSANDFAETVGGFLPTLAQWEFAARGGNRSQGFIYSGSNDINEVAWWRGNSGADERTQPVGQKKPNELGIYDMSGNVNEWLADCLCSLLERTTNPNPTCGDKCLVLGYYRITGGGASQNTAGNVRIDEHNFDETTRLCRYLGFRIAFSADNGTSINPITNKKPISFSFAGVSNGQINLQLQAGNYTAELYNLQGRLVGRTEINATNGINAIGLRTDNISRGVFILNVKQTGNSVLRQKISVR